MAPEKRQELTKVNKMYGLRKKESRHKAGGGWRVLLYFEVERRGSPTKGSASRVLGSRDALSKLPTTGASQESGLAVTIQGTVPYVDVEKRPQSRSI